MRLALDRSQPWVLPFGRRRSIGVVPHRTGWIVNVTGAPPLFAPYTGEGLAWMVDALVELTTRALGAPAAASHPLGTPERARSLLLGLQADAQIWCQRPMVPTSSH